MVHITMVLVYNTFVPCTIQCLDYFGEKVLYDELKDDLVIFS